MKPQIRLQYLSNSGFLLTTEEKKRILIDPYLTDNPAAPFGPDKLPPIDLIIVTHSAFDHLGDSFTLAKRDNASLVGDFLIRELAYNAGVSKKRVKSCSYGGTVNAAGVSLRVLRAYHVSYVKGDDEKLQTGMPHAYMMTTSSGLRIHHLGDTCLYGDMKIIGQLYRPHIGLIPVGAAGPEYGVDLPPSEAALAAQWLGIELAIPIHYHDSKHATQFADAVKLLSPWMEVQCMKPGEVLDISVIKQGVRTTFILNE